MCLLLFGIRSAAAGEGCNKYGDGDGQHWSVSRADTAQRFPLRSNRTEQILIERIQIEHIQMLVPGRLFVEVRPQMTSIRRAQS